MDIAKIMGRPVVIEAVTNTWRGGRQSVCLTLIVDGVGTVLMSLAPERGGDVHMGLRRRPKAV